MMAASTSSLRTEAAPNLAWKWILEKLVDLPAFGLSFIKEISDRISDIEEPHCQSLLERVALRYLEEIVVSNQIDAETIPLLKALVGLEGGGRALKGSSVKDRFNKELILRVQTEAVLCVLRKDIDNWQKDWEGFEMELKRVFTEEDNRQLQRRRELGTLLQPKNQTQTIVTTCLERFCVKELKKDLSMFIYEKKASLNATFLDELSKDFLLGKGPIFQEESLTEKSTDADGHGDCRASRSVLLEDLDGREVQEDILQRQDTGAKTLEVEQKLIPEKCRDEQREDGHEGVPSTRRLKRKLLSSDQGNRNVDHRNPKEGNGGNKSRNRSIGPLLNIESPAKCLRKRDDSGRAITSRRGVLPQGELLKRCPTVVTDEEVGTIFKELDSKLESRDCLHAPERSRPDQSKSPHKPRRRKKYIVHSDVESDAETQVVQNLSSDDEDENLLQKEWSRGGYSGKTNPSLRRENSDCLLTTKGSGQGRSQRRTGEKRDEIGHAENEGIRRRETVNLTYSPDTQGADENVEHHKMTTEIPTVSLETHDSINLEFLDIGSDGHEDFCHNCGLSEELLCCDGCPVAMHSNCLELLGLKVPGPKENWFCPVCLLHKATREAAAAEKAAAEAKKKLKAFMRDSCKNRGLLEEDVLLQNRKENVVKCQKDRGDNQVPCSATGINKALAKNQSYGPSVQLHVEHVEIQVQNPLVQATSFDAQGDNSKRSRRRQDSFTAKEILEEAINANDHILNATHRTWVPSWNKDILCGRMEHNQEPVANDDTGKKDNEEDMPHGRKSLTGKNLNEEERRRGEEAPRMDLKASTSGDREREQAFPAPVVERRLSFERGQETAKQSTGVRERGPSHGVAAEVEGDKHDGDLEEDCGGKLEGSHGRRLSSGRRKIPGLRRKALHWSRAEEDALKKGVKKYSQNGVHGFRWKRILESGAGIFDPSRTYVDLKDKWRNLVKGVS